MAVEWPTTAATEKDTELYQQLLGLTKPWTVTRVELDAELNRRNSRKIKRHREQETVSDFSEPTPPATWRLHDNVVKLSTTP